MDSYFVVLITALIVILVVGLVRVFKGPGLADRMLAAQLFGTVGVALLMLLSNLQGETALMDTALILALLAPLTLIAFVKLADRGQ